MNSPGQASPDSELAHRVAKLWPHREHEANTALALFCRIGLHHWRQLDLTTPIPNKDIRHCFHCSKIKVDGVIYDT